MSLYSNDFFQWSGCPEGGDLHRPVSEGRVHPAHSGHRAEGAGSLQGEGHRQKGTPLLPWTWNLSSQVHLWLFLYTAGTAGLFLLNIFSGFAAGDQGHAGGVDHQTEHGGDGDHQREGGADTRPAGGRWGRVTRPLSVYHIHTKLGTPGTSRNTALQWDTGPELLCPVLFEYSNIPGIL